MALWIVWGLFTLSLTACGQANRAETDAGTLEVETITDGLDHPWGMVFLPDGRALVTERSGAVRILDTNGRLSDPVAGVPEVFARGQGGMLDVDLHPDFESQPWVYLVFSEPGSDGTASTALGRGKWQNDRIEDFEVLFSQQPKMEGPNHFGGRIVFDGDRLFLTTGERFQFDPAQDLSNHLGTVVRLNLDGSVPDDNPFVDRADAEDAIYSYGHRNIEAAAIDPRTGHLWIAEMGPKGGDELNRPEAGKNYGWPVVSWGNNYDDTKIPDPPTRPEFEDAVIHWTPVISPSGMMFYTGDEFPEWKNHMFIGGLSAQGLVVVKVDGTDAEEVDRIDLGVRSRNVVQGPDGRIYVLTDQSNGKVLRLRKSDD